MAINKKTISIKIESIRFGELKKSDLIIHVQHGIGKVCGLKIINVQGVNSEFIEIHYKGKDKLFLPIHRINQIKIYGGPAHDQLIDKLGGSTFEKAKIKVKNQFATLPMTYFKFTLNVLRHIENLSVNQQDLFAFENEFALKRQKIKSKPLKIFMKI